MDFLTITQARSGIPLCALGCGFAGQVANSVIHEGASLASFKHLIPAFIVLSDVLGLCPLTLLAPKMAQVRRIGLREYATLGNRYTEAFDRKWIHFAEPPAEPLLGTADIPSLADLGNSYTVIQ